MMYMQVITPGYRVTLEHDGQHYTLHTDRGRRAVRC
jgi:hemin uptake protein HemP